jgi:hypothetical protein
VSDLNHLDLAHEEKRVRSLLKTAEGKKALENVVGVRFNREDAKGNPLPIISTLMPSHYSPTPETTQGFYQMINRAIGIAKVDPQPSVSSSVVSWVRNDLLARLYASKVDFDYVLFMDDDIVPPADAIEKLLSHNVGIVAGACTVRQDPPLPNFRSFNQEDYSYHTAFEWSGEGLIEIGAVGTGLMLIRRKELEMIADYYVNCMHEVKYLGMDAETQKRISARRKAKAKADGNYWWFEFLKHPLGDGEYGEDISFCFKARELGIPVYVDTTVQPGHVGRYAYSMDDYKYYRADILAQHKVREEESRILVTE